MNITSNSRIKGFFIVLSGIDGSGKTTQVEKLEGGLRESGYSVVTTKQPTEWYLGDSFVRSYFRRDDNELLRLAALALFSASDRARHVYETIIPNLHAGKIVISSRYVFSAYAYFLARGISDIEWLMTINRYAIQPDITFFMDLPARVSLNRIVSRDGVPRKEEQDLMRMSEIRQHFLSFQSDKFIVVNGERDQEIIRQEIMSITIPLLENHFSSQDIEA